MSKRDSRVRDISLTVALGLGGLYLLAPWPGPQAVVHAFIVLGIAPGLRSPLRCALLAATAGWVLESALRIYPGMGGTPLGDMLCALMLWYSLSVGPPEKPFTYYIQIILAIIVHSFVVYFFVGLASGLHPLGTGWQWTLIFLPVWGPLAWRLFKPPHMR